MKWLWFAGPLVLLLTYLGVSVWPPLEERRLRRELQRWIDDYLGPLKIDKKARSRRVRGVPPMFDGLLAEIGGGTRVTDVVLVPKLAYAVARFADAATSTNHFTVLCKLAKPAPRLTCRPLPVVDGRPAPNTGVVFDDPEFTDAFLVDATDQRGAVKWLDEALREALMDLPDAWLRTDGRAMALTIYGQVDADKLDEMVAVADALFAERGAAGGDSLFGEELQEDELVGGGYRARPEARRVRMLPIRSASTKPSAEAVETSEPAHAALRLKAGAIDLALYGLAAILLAAILGKLTRFHPAVFFASPDVVVTEQWQGGWTTKGMGMFIFAETLLVGTFAYQTYLATAHGQSIGMRLLGARTLRTDGAPAGFWRGVVLHSWIFAAPPVVVALLRTRPFAWHVFFEDLVSGLSIAVAGAVVVAVAASVALGKDGRGIHDLVAGTKVVVADRFQLPSVQLGLEGQGVDPLVFKRLVRVGALLVGFVVANVVAQAVGAGFWIY